MECSKSPPNVYFVGSHAVGKTSRAKWVSKTYGLPMLAEVARAEADARGMRVEQMRLDVDLVSDYQRAVFAKQLEAEAALGDRRFVSDRSFDNLAYLCLHGAGLQAVTESEACRAYVERVKRGVVFLVHPHGEQVRSDDGRAATDTSVAGQMVVDGMVKLMLELWGVPYCPVPAASPQEQQLIVGYVLDLAGHRRV